MSAVIFKSCPDLFRGLTCLVSALLLTACAGGDSTSTASATAAPTPTPAPTNNLPAAFSTQHATQTCLWKGPLSRENPNGNFAYPDTGASYWSATVTIPAGSRLFVNGQYPYARYISFVSYDGNAQPVNVLGDHDIQPASGNTNPFIAGNPRYGTARDYQVEIVAGSAPATPAANTLYTGTTGPTVTFWYRVYVPDQGADMTGATGLPTVSVLHADGSTVTEDAACAELNPAASLSTPNLLPQATYSMLRDQANAPDSFPAQEPGVWHFPFNRTWNLQCLFFYSCSGTPAYQLNWYGNPDNAYVESMISRDYGNVAILRGKLPVTPSTFLNNTVATEGQLRYWSICMNEFYTQKVTDCMYDAQVPVDANGNYVIAISRAADRPANATSACGFGWIQWSEVGDGNGHPNDGLLIMRNMLPDPAFANAIQNVHIPGQEQSVIGNYLPTVTYGTTQSFTALGCKAS
ncbi:hypothetical protein [Silvimonas amylolytica]|uniref:Uncharacterized protein n=1 Tax=Silvimonas amylolytica TaxID=449663 RepID=A0ABQ2PP02_9NEIS|nr:hypothetical protein [Silvimonas amylolytica]GGP26752.1 hypothetical protein GCM10010971_25710 [Silvimonas amylolytica]